MKHLTKSTFNNLPFWLPPFEDQIEIANRLNKIDEAAKHLGEQRQTLDQLVKSRFIEMFGSIEDNPFGWPIVRLEECCAINPKKVVAEGSTKVSLVPMNRIGEHGEFDPYGVVEYRELQTGYTSFIDDDVLFAKITPCMENGKGAIAKNLANGIGFGSTELHVLRPMKEICVPEWLYAILSFDHIRATAKANMTGTGGQRRVPASFLKKLKVPLPPMSLQKQYIQELSMVDKLRFDCERASALLSQR